ncbi:MAG TPA: hypothetical protein VFZ00_00080 [Solirubrobacter sp.]|jgi:Zn-dependent protease|nr:hypothetical protein [Solirubrobacter sp.]
MPGRSVRIARIAGIPVGISPWWLLVVALLTWSLGESYFPESAPDLAPAVSMALALASVLLLFAGILAHEFGHALVARRAPAFLRLGRAVVIDANRHPLGVVSVTDMERCLRRTRGALSQP